MLFLKKVKDGGPRSNVEAFFLFEIKTLGSVALLRFNKGAREAFHTHAFDAWTWFLRGDMTEETFEGNSTKYSRGLKPKFTPKENNHRVVAHETSWCFTIRGPWKKTWTEDKDGTRTTFSWGRIVESKESV